jgi:hypothetical protein
VDQRLLQPLPRLLVSGVEAAGDDLRGQGAAALRERVLESAEEARSLGLVRGGRLVTEQL